ncbi:MAG TPA: hypothetical protein VGM84_06115 [Steroidobacteraceae bacterium]|jgi:hypothetical protein
MNRWLRFSGGVRQYRIVFWRSGSDVRGRNRKRREDSDQAGSKSVHDVGLSTGYGIHRKCVEDNARSRPALNVGLARRLLTPTLNNLQEFPASA